MIGLRGSIDQCCTDICLSKIGKIVQNLNFADPARQHFENNSDSHPGPSNRGAPTADSVINRYS